jgi:hypothetical protein
LIFSVRAGFFRKTAVVAGGGSLEYKLLQGDTGDVSNPEDLPLAPRLPAFLAGRVQMQFRPMI